MPFWIENQKANDAHPSISLYKNIDISMLNDKQRLAYDILSRHFNEIVEKQLLVIVTRQAALGKSFLIDSLKQLLTDSCLVCLYFGTAAFNI